MKTPVSPLRYERAVAIVKLAKSREKYANKMWLAAEERNGPLWTENARLRDLVASHERSIRVIAAENRALKARLEVIAASVAA